MNLKQFTLLIGFLLSWGGQLFAQHDVGTTKGDLSVSPTGGAMYEIPIAVPPGVRDIVPGVSLVFNSQDGNGLAGWGWNIGGLSSITRVPTTLYHDGEIDGIDFDLKDRYSLDGQRLIVVKGQYGKPNSEYGTEVYSNLKIVGYGAPKNGAESGPDHFKVYHADGTVATYRHVIHGDRSWISAKKIFEWVLDTVIDPQGNRIKYYYYGSKQRELLRIKKITYGGPIDTNHPTNEIEFYYKTRKKPEVAYAAGNEIFKRVNILDRIEVRGSGQVFRKYQLQHKATSLGYELLTSIQEFNGQGGGLEPITFTYAPETTHNVSNTRSELTMPNALHADERALAGDFDGDAKLDFLLYNNKNKNGIELYQKSKGYASPLNQTFAKWNEITTATVLSAQDKVEVKQALFTLRNMNYGKFEFRAYHLGNDGRFARSYTKSWHDPSLSGGKNSSIHKRFVTGDFDGDGLSEGFVIQDKTHAVDLVDLQRNKTSNFVTRAGQLKEKFDRNTGYFRVADFDGDGKVDLWHILNSKIRIYTLTKNNELTLLNEINDGFISIDRPVLIGDYNGDGKSDCLMPEKNGGTRWKYLMSRGNYYNNEIKYYKDNCFKRKWRIFPQLKYEKTSGDYEYHYVAQDFNGDGKTDLIKHKIRFRRETSSRYKAEENIQLFANDGDERLELVEQPGLQKQGYDTKKKGIPLFLDITCNNGNLEYVYITGRMIQAYEFQKDHRTDVRLDKISHRQVHFELKYDRLEPSSTAYVANHSMKYPYVNINTAPDARLVRQIVQKAPGVERYMDFKYVGAVSHVRGLGFMGFMRREQSSWYGEGVNKTWTITKHDVGKRGAVFESWQALGPGGQPGDPMKQVNYTYQTKVEGGIYINVPTRVITKDHLTGVTSTETLTYDDHYNPLVTSLEHKDGSTTVTRKYSNNINRKDHQYHVGRVLEKVTRTTVGASQSTTTENFAYYGGRQVNLIKSIARKANGSKAVTERFNYDAFGNTISRSIGASGAKTRVETFKFSDDGRFLLQKTDIEGSTTSFTYDIVSGNPLTSTNHLNQTTTNTYDPWGRALTEINHYGKETRFEYYYTQWHNLIKIIHYPEGYSERSSYSPMGWERWSSVTDFRGKHIFTSYEYDVAGRKVKEGVPRYGEELQLWSTIAYDSYGRVKEAVSSTGRRMTYTYQGLSVTTNDGVKTVTTTKDTNGNTISVKDPGGTIKYSYHASGEVHTTEYGGNTIRTFVDAWGRKTQLVDPSAGTFNYKYDSYGNLVEELSPKGKTVTQYDEFGKVLSRKMTGDFTNTLETYTYNQETKLLSRVAATSNGESYSYTYRYDGHYNVNEVIEQNAKAKFIRNTTYDGFGRIARETYTSELIGGQRTEFGIKNTFRKGQLTEVRNLQGNGLLWKLEAQNGRGEVTRAVLGNGMVQESHYDEFGFLQEVLDSRKHGNQQTIALHNFYQFDPQTARLTNRTNEALHSWTERFSYDNLNRLLKVQGARNHTKNYDARGRIRNDNNIGSFQYASTSYQIASIDLNTKGEQYFADRPLRHITYNAQRKPVSISSEDGGKVDFAYSPSMKRSHAYYGGHQADIDKRRYHKHYASIFPGEIVEDHLQRTTKFITYLGGDAYSSSMVHLQKYQGDDVTLNEVHYLHRDYLGSILAISNGNGQVVERRQFGAWGAVDNFESTSVSGGFGHHSLLQRGYTGHEHFFEVGLMHMNGRMYDAVLGTFVSPDNYVQDPTNSQNFNRYGYAYNNPLMYTDPSGEFFFLIPAVAGILGGGAIATAAAAFIVGGASAVLFNGVANLINGQPFFQGAGSAFLIGGISGVLTFGIGNAAQAGLIGPATQHIAHGVIGGVVSSVEGGDFFSGFAAGLVSHTVAAQTGKLTKHFTRTWRAVAMVASGALSGGISSKLAGGSFIAGLKQGFATSLLNQVAHEVWDACLCGERRSDAAIAEQREAVDRRINELRNAGVAAGVATVAGGPRLWLTYTLYNPETGLTYTGRTSGFGAAYDILRARMLGHPYLFNGYQIVDVDRYAYGSWYSDAYAAIRGREQQMIDFNGGARSDGGTSANLIRGVSRINTNRFWYHNQSNAHFGEIYPFTGFSSPFGRIFP